MNHEFKLIPFNIAHIDLIDLREQERREIEIDASLLVKVNTLAEYGMGWTLLYEGRIICIAGWFQIHKGVFEIWSLPSIWVKEFRYAKIYLKQLLRFRKILEEEFKPHRIQSCSIDDPETDKFMDFCGFEKEGTLKNFSASGVTYTQWGRVYPPWVS